jgi:hypothetical protein
MRTVLKIVYFLVGAVILYSVWTGVVVDESAGDFFGQLMKFRLVGFVAMLLVFYYIFFNFLGKKKDR